MIRSCVTPVVCMKQNGRLQSFEYHVLRSESENQQTIRRACMKYIVFVQYRIVRQWILVQRPVSTLSEVSFFSMLLFPTLILSPPPPLSVSVLRNSRAIIVSNILKTLTLLMLSACCFVVSAMTKT
jgi:hypothetical protein